jgi:parvulin-like peptidyl-prolyl isomerase
MKKIVSIFVLVLTLTLVGCGGTKQPKITVEEANVIINMGDNITLLDGVKGFDRKDKDVTDQIKVNKGLFSQHIKGEYEIQYTLDLEDHDPVVATRTVVVKDPLDALGAANISNPEDQVLEYEGLSFTNAQLYRQLLSVVGLQVMMDKINASLLDEDGLTEEAVLEDIEKYRGNLSDEDWVYFMSQFGVIPTETGELDETEVYTFFKLGVMQRLAAEKRAFNAITDEEVIKAKEAYVEDACVINLSFDTEEKATEALALIEAGNVLEGFKAAYVERFGETSTLYDYQDQASCNYERVIYASTTTDYRNLVFSELEVGAYTTEVKKLNESFHLVYKVGVAPDQSTYDEEAFTLGMKNLIVKQKVTNAYVSETLSELRADLEIKIYDPHLYKQYNGSIEGYEEPTDASILVQFGTESITADEVYQVMKNRYAHRFLMDYLYSESVLSHDGLVLTEAMKEQVNQTILQYRQYYLSNNLQTQIDFDYFIYYNTQGGLFNENHLRTYLNYNQLMKDYILGNEEFAGAYPIKDEEIAELNWFEVSASHILYISDRNQDKTITEEEDQEAKALAEAAIKNLMRSNDLKTDFANLAKAESEDPGSKASGGALGYFGPTVYMNGQPRRMVPEFEAGTLATKIGEMTLTPVKTSYGYHIIYVTDKKEVPQKPVGYDELTEQEIQDKPADSAEYTYYAYQAWVENQLLSTKYNNETADEIMKDLLKNRQVTFNDGALERQLKTLYSVNK